MRPTNCACFCVMIALLLGIVVLLKRSRQEQSADSRTQPRSVPLRACPAWKISLHFRQMENRWRSAGIGEKEDNIDVYVKLIGTESMLRLTLTRPKTPVPPGLLTVALLRFAGTQGKRAASIWCRF